MKEKSSSPAMRRVDKPKWKVHSMPVPTGEQAGRWRQSAPIPTYIKTERMEDISVEHLCFVYPPDNLNAARQQLRTIMTAGRTVEEAEAKMRKSLICEIEFGTEEVAGVPPNKFTRKDAETVFQYFDDTTPKTQG